MSKNFTLRLTNDDLANELNKYCEKYCVSRNKLINKLIKEFLDNIENQNNQNLQRSDLE